MVYILHHNQLESIKLREELLQEMESLSRREAEDIGLQQQREWERREELQAQVCVGERVHV